MLRRQPQRTSVEDGGGGNRTRVRGRTGLSVYKLRLRFEFARRPVRSRPTDGLAILRCRASGDWLSFGAEPVRWRRYPSHGPSSERRRHLTELGGECEIVLRTCFVSRLINEADRGPRLAALPENRPRRNQVAPVCPSNCSPMVGKLALLLGLAAAAAGEPATFGTARLGTLTVTASVLVVPKAADMRGVWN